MKKFILIIFIIFLFTGCYNYKELNKIAIVSSISIDKENDNYLVGAQIMNAKSEEQSDSSKIIVYTEKGKTINDALRKITQKSPRMLYPGHLNKLVISEKVAKEGIINVIDLFQRLIEIKDEFTITVAKDIDANKVIKIMTAPEDVPAEYVKYTIENTDIEDALTNSSKLDEFISFYLKDNIDPVVSVIKVKNYNTKGKTTTNTESTSPKTIILLDNIATTYNGKLESFLNQSETIGYNFVRNRVKQMIMPVKCDNKNYSSIEINKSNTKVKVKKENNKYKINFNIKSSGTINEYNCYKNLTKEKTIKTLEKGAENKIKFYIKKAFEKQKISKSRFLGIERLIYLNYPNYKNKNYYTTINVNVNLNRKGEIINSSKGEKYEYKNK